MDHEKERRDRMDQAAQRLRRQDVEKGADKSGSKNRMVLALELRFFVQRQSDPFERFAPVENDRDGKRELHQRGMLMVVFDRGNIRELQRQDLIRVAHRGAGVRSLVPVEREIENIKNPHGDGGRADQEKDGAEGRAAPRDERKRQCEIKHEKRADQDDRGQQVQSEIDPLKKKRFAPVAMRDADRLGAAGSVGQIDLLREPVPPVDGQDTAVRALFRENRDFMTDFAGELERGAFRRRYFQRQPVVFAPPCAAGAERGKRDALESVVQREEDVAAFRSLRNSRRINRERDRFFGQRDFFMRQAEAEPENEEDRQRDRRANCEGPSKIGRASCRERV